MMLHHRQLLARSGQMAGVLTLADLAGTRRLGDRILNPVKVIAPLIRSCRTLRLGTLRSSI